MTNVDDRWPTLDPRVPEESLVLADALLADGDPRGELIVLQHTLARFERGGLPGFDPWAAAARVETLVRARRAKMFVGAVDSMYLYMRFRLGHLDRIRVGQAGERELAALMVVLRSAESSTLTTLGIPSSAVAVALVHESRASGLCFPSITTLVIEPSGDAIRILDLATVFPGVVNLEIGTELVNRVRLATRLARLVVSDPERGWGRARGDRGPAFVLSAASLAQLGDRAMIGMRHFAAGVAAAVGAMASSRGWDRVASLDLSRCTLDDGEARALAQILALDRRARTVCVDGATISAVGYALLRALPSLTVTGSPAAPVVTPPRNLRLSRRRRLVEPPEAA